MSLLRSTTSLLFASLMAALMAPAGAEQVFSTVSTGPVRTYPAAAPYPLGDIYYAPCGWYGNYGGGRGYGRGNGNGIHGSTTLTGERFYPYDIGSNGNRISGRGRGNTNSGYGGGYGNCYGNTVHASPLPSRPQIRATPR